MTEVIAWRDIPGKNNLDLAQNHLAEHNIPSTGRMTGMSFGNFPPISMNDLLVVEEDLEQAVKLMEELTADGWTVWSMK